MLKTTNGQTTNLENESLFPSLEASDVCPSSGQPPVAGPPPQRFDFDRWYNQHSGLVRGLIARFIKDPDVREDLFQITWSRLARVGERYDPTRAKETTFIGLITRRAVLDYLEGEERRSRLLPGLGAAASAEVDFTELFGPARNTAPIESVIAHEQRTLLSEHIAELAPRQRAILYARFHHGLSYRLLAEEFDIPLGTAKSLINRTLARIRRAMNGSNSTRLADPSSPEAPTTRDRS